MAATSDTSGQRLFPPPPVPTNKRGEMLFFNTMPRLSLPWPSPTHAILRQDRHLTLQSCLISITQHQQNRGAWPRPGTRHFWYHRWYCLCPKSLTGIALRIKPTTIRMTADPVPTIQWSLNKGSFFPSVSSLFKLVASILAILRIFHFQLFHFTLHICPWWRSVWKAPVRLQFPPFSYPSCWRLAHSARSLNFTAKGSLVHCVWNSTLSTYV